MVKERAVQRGQPRRDGRRDTERRTCQPGWPGGASLPNFSPRKFLSLGKCPLTPDLCPEGPVSEAWSSPVLIISTLIWLSTATKEIRESHVIAQGQRCHGGLDHCLKRGPALPYITPSAPHSTTGEHALLGPSPTSLLQHHTAPQESMRSWGPPALGDTCCK